MNRIGSRLIERFIKGKITVNFLFRIPAHFDGHGLDDLKTRAADTVQDHHAGEDPVDLASEQAQDSSRIIDITRLTNFLAVKGNHRVAANDNRLGMFLGDRPSFAGGEVEDLVYHRHLLGHHLFEFRIDHFKWQAEQPQNLPPARRGRGENQLHGGNTAL